MSMTTTTERPKDMKRAATVSKATFTKQFVPMMQELKSNALAREKLLSIATPEELEQLQVISNTPTNNNNNQERGSGNNPRPSTPSSRKVMTKFNTMRNLTKAMFAKTSDEGSADGSESSSAPSASPATVTTAIATSTIATPTSSDSRPSKPRPTLNKTFNKSMMEIPTMPSTSSAVAAHKRTPHSKLTHADRRYSKDDIKLHPAKIERTRLAPDMFEQPDSIPTTAPTSPPTTTTNSATKPPTRVPRRNLPPLPPTQTIATSPDLNQAASLNHTKGRSLDESDQSSRLPPARPRRPTSPNVVVVNSKGRLQASPEIVRVDTTIPSTEANISPLSTTPTSSNNVLTVTTHVQRTNSSSSVDPDSDEDSCTAEEKLEKERIKKEKRRTAIVNELVQTEVSYITTLTKIVEQFMNPLSAELKADPQKYIVDGKPLTQADISTIFSNIAMILGFNSQLVQELQARQAQWSPQALIGDIFLRLTPFLKLYTEYSNNYDKSTELIKRASKQSAVFREYLETKRLGEVHLLAPLDSLLIAPVQRIPRYNLLLKDLLKHTDATHPDYGNLGAALTLMEEVADHINNSMKTSDNFRRLMQIENSFTHKANNPTIVLPHRFIIKEGMVTELIDSGKSRKKLCVLLFNDCIIFARPQLLSKLSFKRESPLLQTFIYDIPDTPVSTCMFTIQTPGKTYTVAVLKQKEKDEWIKHVNEARDRQMEIEGAKMVFKLLKKEEDRQLLAQMKTHTVTVTSTTALPSSHNKSNSVTRGGNHICRACNDIARVHSEMERIMMEARKMELIDQRLQNQMQQQQHQRSLSAGELSDMLKQSEPSSGENNGGIVINNNRLSTNSASSAGSSGSGETRLSAELPGSQLPKRNSTESGNSGSRPSSSDKVEDLLGVTVSAATAATTEFVRRTRSFTISGAGHYSPHSSISLSANTSGKSSEHVAPEDSNGETHNTSGNNDGPNSSNDNNNSSSIPSITVDDSASSSGRRSLSPTTSPTSTTAPSTAHMPPKPKLLPKPGSSAPGAPISPKPKILPKKAATTAPPHPPTQTATTLASTTAQSSRDNANVIDLSFPPSDSSDAKPPKGPLEQIGWVGTVTKDEAESMLTKCDGGTFLIRWNPYGSCYTLSYKLVEATDVFVHISNIKHLTNDPQEHSICVTHENGKIAQHDSMHAYLKLLQDAGLVSNPYPTSLFSPPSSSSPLPSSQQQSAV